VKKALKNIVCTVLAVWFFAAAVGYNVAKYCCEGCAVSDISITEMECCGNEAQNHNGFPDLKTTTESGCAMLYVKADFPVTEHSDNQKIEPKVFDLPIVFSQNDFLIEFSTKEYQSNLIKSPPNLCGRDILIQKRVLII
jgi:hypothetical protein